MNRILRTLYLSMIVFGLLLPLVDPAHATPLHRDELNRISEIENQAENRVVYVLTFEGAVTPVLDQYIKDGIATAKENNAVAIILQLDTPGGSVEITKSITQEILASPIPVIIYVAPIGAHAGSAGTFITLAGHAAAMAPGSSIGAASPVGASGEDVGETMEAKVVNILSADIENLAKRRGEEATEWAIAAVQDAAAATAEQALDLGVIDFIARDLPDLLDQLNGLEVTVNGETKELQTEGAFITPIELNSVQQFLNLITNPSIATILLTLGSAGLLAEIWNPGTWIPGTIGLVCLLLGLYALGQLDANFAGLGLIIIALILFGAEIFTPTFGLLTAGGVVAFILGGALLFDAPGVEVPWGSILSLAIALGGFTLFAGGKGLAAQGRPAMTGGESLVGQVATVKNSFQAGELGSVFVSGEWWNAQLSEGKLDSGEQAEIVDRKGYTLYVKRVS